MQSCQQRYRVQVIQNAPAGSHSHLPIHQVIGGRQACRWCSWCTDSPHCPYRCSQCPAPDLGCGPTRQPIHPWRAHLGRLLLLQWWHQGKQLKSSRKLSCCPVRIFWLWIEHTWLRWAHSDYDYKQRTMISTAQAVLTCHICRNKLEPYWQLPWGGDTKRASPFTSEDFSNARLCLSDEKHHYLHRLNSNKLLMYPVWLDAKPHVMIYAVDYMMSMSSLWPAYTSKRKSSIETERGNCVSWKSVDSTGCYCSRSGLCPLCWPIVGGDILPQLWGSQGVCRSCSCQVSGKVARLQLLAQLQLEEIFEWQTDRQLPGRPYRAQLLRKI